MKRRKFLHNSIAGSVGLGLNASLYSACNSASTHHSPAANENLPIVVSTWNNKQANQAAFDVLLSGNRAIDGIEAGIHIPEADPKDMSVGYGGRPDREGNVTLDACIMDEHGNAGSVTYLQHIKHPISVARKVMEETPHVILSGDGALQFAESQGFNRENLLTDEAKKELENWKIESKYEPKVNIERHDTIGMLAMDKHGNLSGGCSTSGLAYKMAGRVGDSPIIGAGLYVDNEVGAATATGMGELVLRSVGSFLIVELMRQGLSPFEACKEGVMRIARRQDISNLQVGYLAINKLGEIGAFSLKSGFVYAVKNPSENTVHKADSHSD